MNVVNLIQRLVRPTPPELGMWKSLKARRMKSGSVEVWFEHMIIENSTWHEIHQDHWHKFQPNDQAQQRGASD